MGEFAGYALDETMDAEDDRFLYRQGLMSDSDAYDLGIIDELGYYNHPPMFFSQHRAPLSKTCRYCGESGLQWKSTEKGWRLSHGNNVHVCDKYKL